MAGVGLLEGLEKVRGEWVVVVETEEQKKMEKGGGDMPTFIRESLGCFFVALISNHHSTLPCDIWTRGGKSGWAQGERNTNAFAMPLPPDP